MSDEAHAQRLGWLKNWNPPGDLSTASRCGAKTRRLPGSSDAERPLSDAWRLEHRAENGGRPEAESARELETRGALTSGARTAGRESRWMRELKALFRQL